MGLQPAQALHPGTGQVGEKHRLHRVTPQDGDALAVAGDGMFMRRPDPGVGQQAVIFGLQRRDHPPDRAILIGVEIHPEPIVQPLIAVDMVHPATVAFDQKAFGRPHGIMVQRDQIIAIGGIG